jgi:hypothetical protein
MLKKEMPPASSVAECRSGTTRFAHPLVPVILKLVCPVTDQPAYSSQNPDKKVFIYSTLEMVDQIVIHPLLKHLFLRIHKIKFICVQYMNAEHHHRPEMVLKIDSVRFTDDRLALKPAGFALLIRLAERSIRVDNLPLIARSSYDHDDSIHEHSYHLTRGLRTLLAATGTLRPNVQHGVQVVKISLPRLIPHQQQLRSSSESVSSNPRYRGAERQAMHEVPPCPLALDWICTVFPACKTPDSKTGSEPPIPGAER